MCRLCLCLCHLLGRIRRGAFEYECERRDAKCGGGRAHGAATERRRGGRGGGCRDAVRSLHSQHTSTAHTSHTTHTTLQHNAYNTQTQHTSHTTHNTQNTKHGTYTQQTTKNTQHNTHNITTHSTHIHNTHKHTTHSAVERTAEHGAIGRGVRGTGGQRRDEACRLLLVERRHLQ